SLVAGAVVRLLDARDDAVAVVAIGLAVAAADRLVDLRAEELRELARAGEVGRAAGVGRVRVAPLAGRAGEAGDGAAGLGVIGGVHDRGVEVRAGELHRGAAGAADR